MKCRIRRVFNLIVLILLGILCFFHFLSHKVDNKFTFAGGSEKYVTKLWSSDFHISPIADIKDVLSTYRDVSIIDKSLSGHCHITGTCAKDLAVIDTYNGMTLGTCPNLLRREFYSHYENDEEMGSVDAFLCLHATSMCELYMPFGRPLIVIASTRFEIGREESNRWQEWTDNLVRIARKQGNIVAANNRYDQEYIKYFSGIRNVKLLPSLCGYVKARYVYPPERSEILIAPSFSENHIPYNAHRDLASALQKIGYKEGVTFSKIRDIYPTYEYEDLAKHPAVVIIPYQVSFMSFFELYKMAIPLFAPSPELLIEWHLNNNILYERTWNGVHGRWPKSRSNIPRHKNADELNVIVEDPNNELDKESMLKWIRYADFYEMPYVTQFDDFDELVVMLKNSINKEKNALNVVSGINFKEISENMSKYSSLEYERVLKEWDMIIRSIKEKKEFRKMEEKLGINVESEGKKKVSHGIDSALRRHYGISLNNHSCLGSHVVENIH